MPGLAAAHPPWRLVKAAAPALTRRWDAGFHLQSSAAGQGWRTIADLGANISEGQRAGRAGGPGSLLYRPSHLFGGLLDPDHEHLCDPPSPSPRAVGPGDVVVSKFVPLRVAMITPATPRHAPDGNCVRIVGLDSATALWVASVLGHKSFAPSIARRSAGRRVARLGARDLAALAVPPPPREVGAIAAAWQVAADRRLAALRDVVAAQDEVQALADELGPELPDPRQPAWVAQAQIPDTWAPDQAALLRYQDELSGVGWSRLAHHLVQEPARLRRELPPARLLRLTDGHGALGFRVPELEVIRPPYFRVYADPLQAGEVLLSTLGTSPRVVFHHPPVDSTVWVSDQWARLRGAHPGSLALVLRTRQVAWQVERAATGAVRQFVGRQDLARVRFPRLSPTVTDRLHRLVCEAVVRRRHADDALGELRTRLDALLRDRLGRRR